MSRTRKILFLAGLLFILGVILLAINYYSPNAEPAAKEFDADRAWKDVEAQMDFGARVPGSEAHQETVEYIQKELKKAGWQVEIQKSQLMGHEIQNIVAKRGSGSPWILFGAHYDSRMQADQDPVEANRLLPVPGANDGASGVAVLLEMARVMPKSNDRQVWLVFFDAEDQGRFSGWDWILGSRAFADSLTSKPDAVIVIDMIGDENLNIYKEQSSDQSLTNSIWQSADSLGYANYFINEEKYNMLDDHTPFLEAGIPAVDIIDFDYPYWHTVSDTTEHISAHSLEVVGNTLLTWLRQQ
jgi:glutaminyl-peptide cyclotransferase